MARPRRKPETPYQRRNKRARDLGYKSYYEQRVAGVPRGKRSIARGHSLDRWKKHGQAAKMLKAIDAETTVSLVQPVSQIRRLANGVYPEIEKLLIGGDGMGRTFMIRNVTRRQLVDLIGEEIRRGASFVKAPSFDQRRIVSEDEAEGGY